MRKNDGNNLSKGEIIEVMIGCIGFVAIVIIMVFFIKDKKNKQADKEKVLI